MPTTIASPRPLTLYADPARCPACRTVLLAPTAEAVVCAGCGVALHGVTAAALRRSLERADRLVGDLARDRGLLPAALPTQLSAQRPGPMPEGPPPPTYPRIADRQDRRGLRASSVPGILLGLGAVCLLVAAVTFLAVAWSWLGVDGRTAVLLGLTLAGAAATVVAGRRGLRAAGESLGAVTCGLVVIDTVGARSAGWLPDSDPALQVLTGVLLALLGTGLLRARPRLAVPPLALVGGLLVAVLGVTSLPRLATLPGDGLSAVGPVLALATLGFLALVARAHLRLRRGDFEEDTVTCTWLRGGALAAAAVTWWALVGAALDRLADGAPGAVPGVVPGVTLGGLWSGPGWVLLAAAGLLALPAVPPAHLGVGPHLRSAAAGSAATLATLVLALPATDDGGTRLGLVALVTTALWTVPAVRRELPGWTRLPALASALPLGGVLLTLMAEAAARVANVPGDLRLPAVDATAHPALVLPSLVVLLALGALLAEDRGLGKVGRATPATALTLGVAVTVALTAVPLSVVVLVLVAGVVVVALVDPGTPQALAPAILAVAAALPSAALLLLACVVLAALTARLARWGRGWVAALAGEVVLAPAVGGAAWALVSVLGGGAEVGGPVVLASVALLALARPRPLLEASVAAVGAVATTHVLLVVDGSDLPGALALHLTLGGALVCLHALAHPARRRLAPVGLTLLAVATWVRLADLGVTTPEAYTLPSALVLVAAGGVRLWRDTSAGTAVLRPGLLLATVPSLLVVVTGDVGSARALLLGLGCLVLVLLGARLRWSTPLLVGAVSGLLLVLAELAPYSTGVPVWILVGTAGVALTVVGVTWEHQVAQVRRVAGVLGRLR